MSDVPDGSAGTSVIINGKFVIIHSSDLTYDAAVFHANTGKVGLHTVTWSVRGQGRGGTLVPGQSKTLEPGLVITAIMTDRA